MLSSLFGSNPCTIDVTLDVEENRKTAPLSRDKRGERAYLNVNAVLHHRRFCGAPEVALPEPHSVQRLACNRTNALIPANTGRSQ